MQTKYGRIRHKNIGIFHCSIDTDNMESKKDLIQNNMTIGGCFHFQGLQNVLLPTEYNFDRKVIDFILPT